jgi:hypothetical protein
VAAAFDVELDAPAVELDLVRRVDALRHLRGLKRFFKCLSFSF